MHICIYYFLFQIIRYCFFRHIKFSYFSADIAKSLDVLDSVIGEFDDGFLSETDARSFYSNSDRKPSKSQFIFNDKIDRMFDDVYEESKVERLNNFGSGANVGHVKSDSEIPGPGTVLSAKRQYLDNLDRDRAGHTQRVNILNRVKDEDGDFRNS